MSGKAKATLGRVTTEGDQLYYEVRGQGRPLLMIAGGLGDAGIYTFVADILADQFKVITYDRRGQSRSTRHDPQNFEISQQGRDAAAVIRAAEERSAIVFGSSSGAAIALELARSQPEVVQALIAHEPPVLRILPDADKWLAFIAGVYAKALSGHMEEAGQEFMASIVAPAATPDFGLDSSVFQGIQERQQETGSGEFGMRCELLPVVNYRPCVSELKKSGMKIVMGIGKVTLDVSAYYGRTVPILSKELDCAMVTFPGHHGTYMVNPHEWTATLRGILHTV